MPRREDDESGEAMTAPVVYCAVPVHNRLKTTARFLEYFNCQTYENTELVIIDDGSSDGTGEFLAGLNQRNLTVLKGDGNLWWGGAMQIAMQYILSSASCEDLLLMLNDDIGIDATFIEELVAETQRYPNAIVGALQCDEERKVVMPTGYRVDYWAMRIDPSNSHEEAHDALPGRGVMIPVTAMQKCGVVNSKLFPHYLSDLEYTLRAKERGWNLRVCCNAIVYTSRISSDHKAQEKGVVSKYLSPRSKNNIFERIAFFSVRGPLLLRLTAVPRYASCVMLRWVGRRLGLAN